MAYQRALRVLLKTLGAHESSLHSVYTRMACTKVCVEGKILELSIQKGTQMSHWLRGDANLCALVLKFET